MPEFYIPDGFTDFLKKLIREPYDFEETGEFHTPAVKLFLNSQYGKVSRMKTPKEKKLSSKDQFIKLQAHAKELQALVEKRGQEIIHLQQKLELHSRYLKILEVQWGIPVPRV